MVTIADPPQTVIKTAAKTRLAWLVGALKLNNTANARQTNNGPLYFVVSREVVGKLSSQMQRSVKFVVD